MENAREKSRMDRGTEGEGAEAEDKGESVRRWRGERRERKAPLEWAIDSSARLTRVGVVNVEWKKVGQAGCRASPAQPSRWTRRSRRDSPQQRALDPLTRL